MDIGDILTLDLDSTEETLYVFGEKGVSFIRLKDRKLLLKLSFGKSAGRYFEINNKLFIYKSYDEFVVIDKSKWLVLGKYKHSSDSNSFFDYVSSDGSFIFEKTSFNLIKMYKVPN